MPERSLGRRTSAWAAALAATLWLAVPAEVASAAGAEAAPRLAEAANPCAAKALNPCASGNPCNPCTGKNPARRGGRLRGDPVRPRAAATRDRGRRCRGSGNRRSARG